MVVNQKTSMLKGSAGILDLPPIQKTQQKKTERKMSWEDHIPWFPMIFHEQKQISSNEHRYQFQTSHAIVRAQIAGQLGDLKFDGWWLMKLMMEINKPCKTNVKHTQKKQRTTHWPVQEHKISDDVRLWKKWNWWRRTGPKTQLFPTSRYIRLPGYPTVGAIRITWKSIDLDFGCWALMVPPILAISRPRENRSALIQVLKTVDTISE